MTLHPLTGEVIRGARLYVFPATHYAFGRRPVARAMDAIEKELGRAAAKLRPGQAPGSAAAPHAHAVRSGDDAQVGICPGIENYSRHLDGRRPGTAPNCLLDYFPKDFLLVIDETHVTVPQIGAMYKGDKSRKRPSSSTASVCPARWITGRCMCEEFLERIGQAIFCRPRQARMRWSSPAETSSSRSSGRPA